MTQQDQQALAEAIRRKFHRHGAAWFDLLCAADRVSRKYGHDEQGEPSDWQEWKDLRDALADVRQSLLGSEVSA